MKTPGFPDVLDIGFVATLVYALLVWFKQTKAAFVAMGFLALSAIYLAARIVDMRMTTDIFRGFFDVFIIAIVVIFQEELRQAFERLALRLRGFGRGPGVAPGPREIEVLVRTAGKFAREKTGALIVLRGKDPLDRHLEAGWDLGGMISEALIESIFDWHSLGHDGAVVVEDGRISRFGCHLPLSKESSKVEGFGTRHAAALGLSERTDALAIVVSEEKGTVSVAQGGELVYLGDIGALQEKLGAFYAANAPQTARGKLRHFLRRNIKEKLAALAIAIVAWMLLVGL